MATKTRKLMVVVGGNITQFEKAMKNLNKTMTNVKKDLGLQPLFGAIATGAKVAGGALAAGFGAAIYSGVKANSQMELYKSTLDTVMQDSKKAAETLDWVKKYAAKTPFEIPELVDATTRLAAAGQEAKKFVPLAADMAAVFKSSGKTVQDAAEAINDAMVGEFERLKEFGIKLAATDFKKGGKYAGKTYAEGLEEEFKKHNFAGAAEALGKTFEGRLSTIKDFFGQFVQKVTVPLFDRLSASAAKLLDKLNKLQSEGKLDQWADKVSKSLSRMADVAAKIGTVIVDVAKFIYDNWSLISPVLAGVVAGFAALKIIVTVQKWIGALKVAWMALSAVFTTNPIGALCLLLGVLVTAGVAVYQNWDVIKAKAVQAWGSIKQTFNADIGAIIGGFAALMEAFGATSKAANLRAKQAAYEAKAIREEALGKARTQGDVDMGMLTNKTKAASSSYKDLANSAGFAGVKIKSTGDAGKSAADKIKEANERAKDKLNQFGDQIVSALKRRYEKAEKIEVDAAEKSIKIARDASEERIKQYEKEYKARVKALDTETNSAVNALQDQIDAIEAEAENEQKALRLKEQQTKVSELRAKLAQEGSAEDRESIQKDLNDVLTEIQQDAIDQQRESRIKAIRDEMEQIQEQAELKKEQYDKELEEKKEKEENTLQLTIDRLEKEKQAIQDNYERLTSEENLNAESRRLAVTKNQQEIINLLNGFNPSWRNAGQSFGDQLIDGLNSKRGSVQSAVSDILSLVRQADDAAERMQSSQSSSSTRSYTVRAGDTLSRIASMFSTTVSKIASANSISNTSFIRTGQVLRIPAYSLGVNYHLGGAALVGENGPEIVDLPRGVKVNTASESKRMRTVTNTFYVYNPNMRSKDDIGELAKRLDKLQEDRMRSVGL